MTYEDLIRLLDRLRITAGYYCDEGLHRGMMRIHLAAPYMTPDELAWVQKEYARLEGR